MTTTPLSKAFIFDLNGTMIDDMGFHTDAWHGILTKDLGADLTKEEVKLQMYGKNEELLVRVFGEGRFTNEEMGKISMEKEHRYQEAFRPHLKLIDGLGTFLEEAHRQLIPMAIGSAAITFNVDFILDNLDLRPFIPVAVSANDVQISKPHPETFLKAAEMLGIDPENCIVFEDNPKGVEAALRAGMNSVVLTTMHEEHEFGDLPNILAFVKDYNDPFVRTLLTE
ncbi:HAD family hydrolase [Hufsiella ginkgonis]|uniref:HAD-IA family hydrolase n=1 Tax=Hufsiella ginkgonis TaxID=2695274 RepID=A0A7K1Y3G3_9SPHI|nr:HAD family phosphatase [Hufsiella ginkgonis]MXV17834.1 HAD-IA family hydrolase [Hufsiella ginkgonis]